MRQISLLFSLVEKVAKVVVVRMSGVDNLVTIGAQIAGSALEVLSYLVTWTSVSVCLALFTHL